MSAASAGTAIASKASSLIEPPYRSLVTQVPASADQAASAPHHAKAFGNGEALAVDEESRHAGKRGQNDDLLPVGHDTRHGNALRCLADPRVLIDAQEVGKEAKRSRRRVHF